MVVDAKEQRQQQQWLGACFPSTPPIIILSAHTHTTHTERENTPTLLPPLEQLEREHQGAIARPIITTHHNGRPIARVIGGPTLSLFLWALYYSLIATIGNDYNHIKPDMIRGWIFHRGRLISTLHK